MNSCDKCSGLGCFTFPQDGFARARLCECVENCVKCGGLGFRVEIKNGYRYKVDCAGCSGVRSNIWKYNRAQIPAFILSQRVSSQHPGSRCAQVMQYVDDFTTRYPGKKGFVLSGSPGRGKTFIAASVVADLTLKYGVDSLFQDLNVLILKIKDREEGVSEFAVLEPLFKTQLLVIDGVGPGGRRLTDWEQSVLENIVSNRYSSNLKIILTTKHDKSSLEGEMGDLGFSKISRMCNFLNLD